MKRYVEPDPKARQMFFLALALVAAFAFAVARLDRILPPLSSNPSVALDQVATRLLLAAAFSSVFHSLTPPSSEQAPASRRLPLMSNVSRLKQARVLPFPP